MVPMGICTIRKTESLHPISLPGAAGAPAPSWLDAAPWPLHGQGGHASFPVFSVWPPGVPSACCKEEATVSSKQERR